MNLIGYYTGLAKKRPISKNI